MGTASTRQRHTAGPLIVRLDGTWSGAWAEIGQLCVDPLNKEEWFRELGRTETTHVERYRNGRPLPGPVGTIEDQPHRFKLTADGAEHIANAHLWAAAAVMLEALEAEEEWRAREAAGALDPNWSYERMVADKRRAAIALATTPTTRTA